MRRRQVCRQVFGLVLVVVSLGAVTVACGDGEQSAATTTTTNGPATGEDQGGPPTSVAAAVGPSTSAAPIVTEPPAADFCGRAQQLNRLLTTTNASNNAAIAVVAAQLNSMAEVAPPELAADMANMLRYWNRLASVDSNDLSQIAALQQKDPEETASGQKVTAYLVDVCGVQPTA